MINKNLLVVSLLCSSLLFGCNTYETEQLKIKEEKTEIFDKIVKDNYNSIYLNDIEDLKTSDLYNIKERIDFLESINENLLNLSFNDGMRELDTELMKEEFIKLKNQEENDNKVEKEINALLIKAENFVLDSYENNKTINLYEYLITYNNYLNDINNYLSFNELLEIYNKTSVEDLENEINKKIYNIKRNNLLGNDSVDTILEIIVNDYKLDKLDFNLKLLNDYVSELANIEIKTGDEELKNQIKNYNKKVKKIYELALEYNNPNNTEKDKLEIKNKLKNLNDKN